MRRARITNLVSGVAVDCHATTDHPDSHYGREVWVDELGIAYFDVGATLPYYHVKEYTPEQCAAMDLGERIAAIRMQRGMQQRQLAELAGITIANMSRIEGGKYSVGLHVLARLAAALGCRLDFAER